MGMSVSIWVGPQYEPTLPNSPSWSPTLNPKITSTLHSITTVHVMRAKTNGRWRSQVINPSQIKKTMAGTDRRQIENKSISEFPSNVVLLKIKAISLSLHLLSRSLFHPLSRALKMAGPKQRKRVEAETSSLKRARDGSAFIRWYAFSPCFFMGKSSMILGIWSSFRFLFTLVVVIRLCSVAMKYRGNGKLEFSLSLCLFVFFFSGQLSEGFLLIDYWFWYELWEIVEWKLQEDAKWCIFVWLAAGKMRKIIRKFRVLLAFWATDRGFLLILYWVYFEMWKSCYYGVNAAK